MFFFDRRLELCRGLQLGNLQQHEHGILLSRERRQLLPQQSLNPLVQLNIIPFGAIKIKPKKSSCLGVEHALRNEGDGPAAATGAGGAAHAMDVVFAIARDFKVDDEIDADMRLE